MTGQEGLPDDELVGRLGVDGTDIAWEDLVEVQLAALSVVVAEDAAVRVADRIKVYLSPVPGRAWLVRRGALLLGGLAARWLDNKGEEPPLVPVSFVRRTRLSGQRTATGGLTAALLLAAMPEVRHVLLRTAQSRRLPVTSPGGEPYVVA